MARPDCIIKTPADPTFSGSTTIDDQVGFYSQSKQPHLNDINARVEQAPAAPDPRFTSVVPEK